MSFFITSTGSGDGGNLGGLTGADAHCQQLAAAVGQGSKTWHAYWSTSATRDQIAVNARDRIGKGPRSNARGARVAEGVEDLHSPNNRLNKGNSLTERGAVVNRRGDTPNMHDILTGSRANGQAFTDTLDHTCSNWTSNAASGSAHLGHHDRQGGGADPTSWNSAHASRGCGQRDLASTGGAGLFSCFAAE